MIFFTKQINSKTSDSKSSKPPHAIYCHQSELRIFLLFFASLSSWTMATCWAAVGDLSSEVKNSGKIKTKTQMQGKSCSKKTKHS